MFWLAKAVGALLAPGNVIVLALIVALLLSTRRRRVGRWLLWVVALAMLALTLLPVGRPLQYALENRFASPSAMPARVDGIVVLGGSSNPALTAERGQISFGGAVEREIEAAALAARFPQAKVIIAGGMGSDELREADVEGELLVRLGVDRSRLILERRSRNTAENLGFAFALANPTPDEVWILVTSALHMPRAMGVARRLGWTMLPFPVDYGLPQTSPGTELEFDFLGHLGGVDRVVHQWVGLIAYRILGRTDAFYPGPSTN